MKWPKIRIRRIDMERVLIGCSAVLVLLLSVSGRNGENEPYEERLEEIPQGEVAVSATEKDMQQTVVYYEDADGYLVPVQRDVPRREGIAKATLEMMVQRDTVICRRPAPQTGAENSCIIVGHALPNTASGRPRLMNVI